MYTQRIYKLFKMTTLLHVRVPEEIKAQASKIFAELGIDLSTGIKIYLTKVVENKGIPFQMKTREGLIQELKDAHVQVEKGDFLTHQEIKAKISKKAFMLKK